jgi:Large eukaryotic DNA virus major capsid protein/Major capsid protein N-terminus
MNRAVGTGALNCLAAQGPQNSYFPVYSPPTGLVDYHRPLTKSYYYVPMVNYKFLGTTIDVPLRNDIDLMTNAFLKFSLPPGNYSELVGRAVLKEIHFLIDGSPIEILTDNWLIVRDQIFLTADEKYATYDVVSNGNPEETECTGGDYYVPLEFFFTRRKTDPNKPALPICAMIGSNLSIRFTFNTSAWISNQEVDLVLPTLVVEYYTISDAERLQYLSATLSFRVPVAYTEHTIEFRGQTAIVHMTPNFPIDMLVWFIQDKTYDDDVPEKYNLRYQWGYNTQHVHSSVPLTFFNGVQRKYVDVVDTMTMYLNGQQILQGFPDGTYYSLKVPLERGLSIPTKNLYMYSFADLPAELETGGTIDFSKLNSTTTHLDLKFKAEYISDIFQNYSLNLFFFGYKTLEIVQGRTIFSG